MRVLRTVVFPALRLVVWAVIAVALVFLAFRGGGTDTAEPTTAAGPQPVDLTSPQVPVTLGTVQNTVTVDGTVVADPAVPVKATAAGKVRKVLLVKGDVVAVDQPLFEITVTTEREPLTSTDAEGNQVVTPRAPLVSTVTVKSPAAGVIASLDVLVDQLVEVGDAAGSVSPGTLSVSATLSQGDQFRLLSPPAIADVTVQGGPAPFVCSGLTLGTPEAAGGAGDGLQDPGFSGAPPTTGGTTARCAVPTGVAVFPGMAASVAVQAGLAENVPTLPITAVQGTVQSGNVWVVGPDGTPVETPVTLGLTDGQVVHVTGGVTEGQLVLEFVPVPDDAAADSGMYGMGGFGG